ncbi:SAP domain-containing protein [Cladophialophora immunda]|nr:SAP domain-containing protein [Cladophialophora immunda]
MAGTMADYMPAQAQENVQALIAQVKTLTVEKLKNVLRSEGLPLSGVKSELQIRTIAHIEKLRNAADMPALNRIRGTIRGVPLSYQNGNSYHPHYSNHTPTSSASPQFSSPNAHISYNMPSNPLFGSGRITFKTSPFYVIARPLTQMHECKARESTRDTARLIVSLPQETIETLKNPSYRVMVFCAPEVPGFYPREPSDIAFPHNVELKCNSMEVKANLKGLKNRPGSTRPADITSLLKKKPANYPNTVEMIYALTTKKFFVVVNLVLQKQIDAMVAEIRRGRMITKDQVIREMRRKAEDPDEIVATSMVLSLKDPVGYTRITTPCRGVGCNHVQCFDAALYLQLQEQAPTWTCPICNRAAPWDQLALDQYVNDILNLTPKSVEAVNVEPDGKWHIQSEHETTSRRSNPTPSDDDDGDDDDDDGDLVEIRNGPSFRLSNLETLTPHSVKTPPLSSREVSTAPSAAKQSGHSKKRPREVIDLTLSDEEDDGPAPKAPRTSNSYSSVDVAATRHSPPDRVFFQLHPPPQPSPYNYDRFNPSL